MCICKNLVHSVVEMDYTKLVENNAFSRVASDDLKHVICDYMVPNGYKTSLCDWINMGCCLAYH